MSKILIILFFYISIPCLLQAQHSDYSTSKLEVTFRPPDFYDVNKQLGKRGDLTHTHNAHTGKKQVSYKGSDWISPNVVIPPQTKVVIEFDFQLYSPGSGTWVRRFEDYAIAYEPIHQEDYQHYNLSNTTSIFHYSNHFPWDNHFDMRRDSRFDRVNDYTSRHRSSSKSHLYGISFSGTPMRYVFDNTSSFRTLVIRFKGGYKSSHRTVTADLFGLKAKYTRKKSQFDSFPPEKKVSLPHYITLHQDKKIFNPENPDVNGQYCKTSFYDDHVSTDPVVTDCLIPKTVISDKPDYQGENFEAMTEVRYRYVCHGSDFWVNIIDTISNASKPLDRIEAKGVTNYNKLMKRSSSDLFTSITGYGPVAFQSNILSQQQFLSRCGLKILDVRQFPSFNTLDMWIREGNYLSDKIHLLLQTKRIVAGLSRIVDHDQDYEAEIDIVERAIEKCTARPGRRRRRCSIPVSRLNQIKRSLEDMNSGAESGIPDSDLQLIRSSINDEIIESRTEAQSMVDRFMHFIDATNSDLRGNLVDRAKLRDYSNQISEVRRSLDEQEFISLEGLNQYIGERRDHLAMGMNDLNISTSTDYQLLEFIKEKSVRLSQSCSYAKSPYIYQIKDAVIYVNGQKSELELIDLESLRWKQCYVLDLEDEEKVKAYRSVSRVASIIDYPGVKEAMELTEAGRGPGWHVRSMPIQGEQDAFWWYLNRNSRRFHDIHCPFWDYTFQFQDALVLISEDRRSFSISSNEHYYYRYGCRAPELIKQQ